VELYEDEESVEKQGESQQAKAPADERQRDQPRDDRDRREHDRDLKGALGELKATVMLF